MYELYNLSTNGQHESNASVFEIINANYAKYKTEHFLIIFSHLSQTRADICNITQGV